MASVCYLDTETTGLKPKYHEVIEIYARWVRSVFGRAQYSKRLYALPSFEDRIQPEAAAVNGYKRDTWPATDVVGIDAFAGVVNAIAGSDYVLGWNVSYDVDMLIGQCELLLEHRSCTTQQRLWLDRLKRELKELRADKSRMIDIRAFCNKQCKRIHVYGNPTKHSAGKLTEICKVFGIEGKDASHTAKGDVERLISIHRHFRVITHLSPLWAKRYVVAVRWFNDRRSHK